MVFLKNILELKNTLKEQSKNRIYQLVFIFHMKYKNSLQIILILEL